VSATVEIFSATDPPYLADRRVLYWLEFNGRRSVRAEDWATVDRWATAICAEHDACIIDRSDKGSGLLRATLRR
jgi:hypothetical protein